MQSFFLFFFVKYFFSSFCVHCVMSKWEKPSKGESFGLFYFFFLHFGLPGNKKKWKRNLYSVDLKSSQCLFCWQFCACNFLSAFKTQSTISVTFLYLVLRSSFLQKKCEVAPVSFKNWFWLTGSSAQYPSHLFFFLFFSLFKLLPSPNFTTLNGGHHVS